MVQNFAFAYAIIMDGRKKPLFPKELAIVNIIMPILFAFATGIHTVRHGPLAWNGVITFYIVGFSFVLQLIVDAVYLALAVREEAREEALEYESDNVVKHTTDSKTLDGSMA